ncbi:hypothetical protein RF007C_02020 [Ruminococcus flavefaciens 007c]|uniref:Uncharacterized protein n=1 Tax=Ruminococcus flavefaciens 007c TaxID=1341157 RepID=W7UAV0_RUMFL|nr:hypothetical protein RF007C_02020 [Ruminococcus flavefaciens 007c]
MKLFSYCSLLFLTFCQLNINGIYAQCAPFKYIINDYRIKVNILFQIKRHF